MGLFNEANMGQKSTSKTRKVEKFRTGDTVYWPNGKHYIIEDISTTTIGQIRHTTSSGCWIYEPGTYLHCENPQKNHT
jgi:endonuclease YncB( thermonuclease family)